MAHRESTGFKKFRTMNGSVKRALQGGKMLIYSGSQPASADDAVSGTLLGTITLASGAYTAETLATGTVTLNSGASGSVDSITVNSVNILPAAVPFNTSLTQTAADVATAINKGLTSPEYTATSAGAVITISAVPGTGTSPNTFVVTPTCTTISASSTNMSGGVAAVNGLTWGEYDTVTRRLSKDGVWSGVWGADGTPGWYRIIGPQTDAGGSSTTAIRIDGNIAASGANLNISPLTAVNATTITIDSFYLEV